MTADEIVAKLRPLGRDSYKKTLLKHGIPEPFLGVSIEEMKKIQKLKLNGKDRMMEILEKHRHAGMIT